MTLGKFPAAVQLVARKLWGSEDWMKSCIVIKINAIIDDFFMVYMKLFRGFRFFFQVIISRQHKTFLKNLLFLDLWKDFHWW